MKRNNAVSLNVFGQTKARKEEQRKADLYRAILHYEARLGGELFGPIPKDVRREFFCLDEHTWVWHEEWTDAQGQHQAVTTRYDVRPSGVVKSQGSNSYQALSQQEAHNLYRAVKLYKYRICSELTRLAQQTA
jgi:hypothetical protein